ncbi:MAG: hypothetical protein WC389_13930 [Lutibacter sp.]|jgi:hypothetical protein
MEPRITDIQVIYEFTNKDSQATYGVYLLKFKGERHLFIRNGESVGTVAHYSDRPASECVSIIKNDVKEEFFAELKKMNEVKCEVK